jgi:hypothetical protein
MAIFQAGNLAIRIGVRDTDEPRKNAMHLAILIQ